MLKLNFILFTASVLILWLTIYFRVHIHIEYQPRTRKRQAWRRQANSEAPSGQAVKVPSKGAGSREQGRQISGEVVNPALRRDLISALVNLDAPRKEAEERADAALAQGPGDFDALILRALQHGNERMRNRRNPR